MEDFTGCELTECIRSPVTPGKRLAAPIRDGKLLGYTLCKAFLARRRSNPFQVSYAEELRIGPLVPTNNTEGKGSRSKKTEIKVLSSPLTGFLDRSGFERK